MVRYPFTGPATEIQDRGRLGVYKQDFNAHQDGTGFRQAANTIDMVPTLPKFSGATVQDVLDGMDIFLSTGVVYYTIGDGVNSLGVVNVGDAVTPTIEDCFTAALASPNISNNKGVIFLKSGTYNFVSSITLPAGISVFGEIGGTLLNATTSNPIFITSECANQSIGANPTVYADGHQVIKFYNLTFFDGLNSTPKLGSSEFIKCNRGSNIEVERCSFFGKSNTSNNATTKYCIYFDNLSSSSYASLLSVKNSYFYGVQTVVDFYANSSTNNRLEFRNNRVWFSGQIGGATNRALSAVSFIACDATLCNNDFTVGINASLYTTKSCFCCFDPGSSTLNKNLIITGNTLNTVAQTLTNLKDPNNNLIREDNSGLKYIRSLISGNIIGGSSDSNSWYVVIGDGAKTIGDINGEFAIQQFLKNYIIDRTDATHGHITLFIKPGSYTITDDSFKLAATSIDYKLIGLSENGNLPTITLAYTSPNAGAENNVIFGSHIENLYFKANLYYYRIKLKSSNVNPDSRVNYFANLIAKNCAFHNCGIEASPV